MDDLSSNNSMNIKREIKSFPTKCTICGGPAIYSYFGVISCQPCKVFFRRNAKQGREVLKCDFDGDCEINVKNRHVCSYCRLMKCFKSGMQADMIRSSQSKSLDKTSRKRKEITDSTEETSTNLVRSNESVEFPTLNLLRSDQSTLSVDQWSLLSSLSHCYDEHSGLLIGERFMNEQNLLPPMMRFRDTPMIEFIQKTLYESQLLYRSNQDFISLSADDRSILLHNTFKHVASLSSNFIIYNVRFMDYPAYYNAVEIISHSNVAPVAKRIANRLDFDMMIMKLFLVILSFSTINYTVYSNISPVNLSNIKEVLRIQDTYIELLWQYLLYKYNFEKTVKCLSELIRCFFAVNEAVVKTNDLQWLTNTIESIVEETELALIFDE